MNNYLILLVVIFIGNAKYISGVNPEFFKSSLGNLTTILGEKTEIVCSVQDLGDTSIAWVRSEERVVLAIGGHAITRDHRISVFYNQTNEFSYYKLTISNTKLTDTGKYLCQINTNPMRYIAAYLSVVESPEFKYDMEEEETSTVEYYAQPAKVMTSTKSSGTGSVVEPISPYLLFVALIIYNSCLI